jgi:hypothetical protein
MGRQMGLRDCIRSSWPSYEPRHKRSIVRLESKYFAFKFQEAEGGMAGGVKKNCVLFPREYETRKSVTSSLLLGEVVSAEFSTVILLLNY